VAIVGFSGELGGGGGSLLRELLQELGTIDRRTAVWPLQ